MIYPQHCFPHREMLLSGDGSFSNLPSKKKKKKKKTLPIDKGTIFTHLE